MVERSTTGSSAQQRGRGIGRGGVQEDGTTWGATVDLIFLRGKVDFHGLRTRGKTAISNGGPVFRWVKQTRWPTCADVL